MALDIVEEAREAGRARRMADQAHMQADRHHLRLCCAFLVEHVEGVLMPREIIGRRAEEAALLHHEPAGVHAWPIAAIPAERPLPDRRLERGDRLTDVLALVVRAQFIMLD